MMIFQTEATYQQFVHSNFRENTIRLLYITCADGQRVFLAVNKYGKVGLYDPDTLNILHTYALDLSSPMKADMGGAGWAGESNKPSRPPPLPKCQRTHLVADAVHAADMNAVLFATTKNILQLYDLGDIESLRFGLELFPRQKLLKFRSGQSPVVTRNRGQVETHRVFGLPDSAPFYCMEYIGGTSTTTTTSSAGSNPGKLIIGDKEGIITIISVADPGRPFGKAKARGVLHQLLAGRLEQEGVLRKYRAHRETIREIRTIPGRDLILSCSRDEKFSLFIKDYTEATEPYIISLPKGVNTFAHSEPLKLIATGSEDWVVRLFNQFLMSAPQMELLGHRSPVIALEFLQVPFSDKPLLVSYSTDAEVRAWDPLDYVCLQSLHISFPAHSIITASKCPEFGKRPLIVHQPHYNVEKKQKPPDGRHNSQTLKDVSGPDQRPISPTPPKATGAAAATTTTTTKQPPKGEDGTLILLYCNAYAKLRIVRDTSYWPFEFDDFVTEFQEVTTKYEKKLEDRQAAYAESKYCSRDPNVLKLSPEEVAGIEARLDSYVKDMLKMKRHADKQLRSSIYDSTKPSLAGETTRKFLELHHRSANLAGRHLRKEMSPTLFKYVPLYEPAPVEFAGSGRPLPTTSIMAEAGMGKITSVSHLLTPLARKFFTGERLKESQFEALITARTEREEVGMQEEEEEEEVVVERS